MKKLQLNKLSLSDSSKLSAKEKKEIAGGYGNNIRPICTVICPAFSVFDQWVCIGNSCYKCGDHFFPSQWKHLCNNNGGIIVT